MSADSFSATHRTCRKHQRTHNKGDQFQSRTSKSILRTELDGVNKLGKKEAAAASFTNVERIWMHVCAAVRINPVSI